MKEKLVFNTLFRWYEEQSLLEIEIPIVKDLNTGLLQYSNLNETFKWKDRLQFIGCEVLDHIKSYGQHIPYELPELFNFILENSKLEVVKVSGQNLTNVTYPDIKDGSGNELIIESEHIGIEKFFLSSIDLNAEDIEVYILSVSCHISGEGNLTIVGNDIYKYKKDTETNTYVLDTIEDFKTFDIDNTEGLEEDVENKLKLLSKAVLE